MAYFSQGAWTVGGSDTNKGIGFQNAYSVCRLLELTQPGSKVVSITPEGQHDIEDLVVERLGSIYEVVQVKKRETTAGSAGLWTLGDLKKTLRAFFKIESTDMRSIQQYRFVGTGNANPAVQRLQDTCKGLSSSAPTTPIAELKDDFQKGIADVHKLLEDDDDDDEWVAPTEKTLRDFLIKLVVEIPARTEDALAVAAKYELMAHHEFDGLSAPATYHHVFKHLFDLAKLGGQTVRRDELLEWLQDIRTLEAARHRRAGVPEEDRSKLAQEFGRLRTRRAAAPDGSERARELDEQLDHCLLRLEDARRRELHRALLRFDFGQLASFHMAYGVVLGDPVAFMIHGERASQAWVVNQLIHRAGLERLPPWKLSLGRVGHTTRGFWSDIRRHLGTRVEDHAELIVLMSRRLLRDPLVLIIAGVFDDPGGLRAFIKDVWAPLVRATPSNRRTALMAFFISEGVGAPPWQGGAIPYLQPHAIGNVRGPVVALPDLEVVDLVRVGGWFGAHEALHPDLDASNFTGTIAHGTACSCAITTWRPDLPDQVVAEVCLWFAVNYSKLVHEWQKHYP